MSQRRGMNTEKVFYELSAYFGYPESKTLLEILKRVVSREEAFILLNLPGTLEEISNKTGIPVQRLRTILEKLFERGIVLTVSVNGKTVYALCNEIDSIVVGIGAKRARGKLDKVDLEILDLAKTLTEEYLRYAPEEDEAYVRVIPIERTLPTAFEVLPYEVLSKIIREAKVIAVAECVCRTKARRCNNPTETCILLDRAARIALKRNIAREVSVDEALKILEMCEELGLVHCTNNASYGLEFICNCCPCCCIFLRGLIQYGRRDSVVKSRYQAVVDTTLCTGCGVCESVCVFGAMKVEEGVARSDAEKCFGCGLCVSKCPNGAIRLVLVKGEEHIPVRKAQSIFFPTLPDYDTISKQFR